MNYETAKAYKAMLQRNYENACASLKAIPGVASMPDGRMPDEVKGTLEYRTLQQARHYSFEQLRAFNQMFVKHFKREIMQERRKRLTTLAAVIGCIYRNNRKETAK